MKNIGGLKLGNKWMTGEYYPIMPQLFTATLKGLDR
jgi:hypothetical protein